MKKAKAKIYNSVHLPKIFLDVEDTIIAEDLRTAARAYTHDGHLLRATQAVGRACHDNDSQAKLGLLELVAEVFTWLETKGYRPKQILSLVCKERIRQRTLLQKKAILFDCSCPHVARPMKVRVLVEELGEVASAIDNYLRASVMGPKFMVRGLQKKLIIELVQVAAVAVAWLESLEAKR